MKHLFFAFLTGFMLLACANTPENTAEQKDGIEAAAPIEAKAKPVAQRAEGVAVGEQAPDFELTNVDGKTYSLATITDANGNKPKGYVVVFTCNTCPFAVASEQRIIDLHQKYAPKGYPVVAIQPNDPEIRPDDGFEAMQERAKEMDYNFVYLLDEGQKVYPAYGATRTPEVFLLDADRYVKYHGAIDDSVRDPEGVEEKYLENAIEALMKNETPHPVVTKAVGCSIKA
ncbi:MAG: thioredoxin family protein [Phaeodactylibacter sp.]|nr:thioredoxin family protein [Phaeodactylibacter sp.]